MRTQPASELEHKYAFAVTLSDADEKQNVANQINSFNSRCPNTKLVYVGYSQVKYSVTFFSRLLIIPGRANHG